MIQVFLSPQMKNKAKELAGVQTKKRLFADSRQACRPDYEIIGFLGVLAVKKYFDAINVSYWEHPEDTGKNGDNYDLVVLFENKKIKVDVKTSRKYTDIVVKEKLRDKALRNNTLLVGVHLNDNVAEILGYCSPKQLVFDDYSFAHAGAVHKLFVCKRGDLHKFKISDIYIS